MGGRLPSATPLSGWQVASRLEPLGDAFLVSIEWRRRWDGGREIDDGRQGSVEVAMRVGDRVPLDQMFLPVNVCDAAGLRLDAGIVMRPSAHAGGGGGGGGAAAGARGTGGRGVATGRVNSGSGSATTGSATTSAGQDPRAEQILENMRELSRRVKNATTYLAEFWLVHTPPGGGEHVQRIAVTIDPYAPSVEFPPVPISTPQGERRVRVTVRLRVVPGGGRGTATGGSSVPPELEFLVMRTIVAANVTAFGTGGTSTRRLPLPSPSDVLSFELPAPPGDADQLGGHAFALRLRVVK
jgi:hypothetical protein